MPVAPEELSVRYPVLYHMAAPRSWPSIARHGLHSTTSLLDLFGITGVQRRDIEERHRPESVAIEHPEHGIAIVRDQKPMDDAGLRRALGGGLTPRDWYLILNRKVFFWVRRSRLETMMSARAYRNQEKTVLYVRTAELLERHAERVVLAPMNTGCTKPWPHPRGPATFAALDVYPYDEYVRKKRLEAVVEMAVEGSVPDIRDLVLRAEEIRPGGEARVVFER